MRKLPESFTEAKACDNCRYKAKFDIAFCLVSYSPREREEFNDTSWEDLPDKFPDCRYLMIGWPESRVCDEWKRGD